MPGTKKNASNTPAKDEPVSDTAAELQSEEIHSQNNLAKSEFNTELRLDMLKPYKDNPFKPYTGKRLERLTNSIRSEGVKERIKVRPLEDGSYEILSGHNRVSASKEAGKETIIATVLEGLNDDEAIKIVTASNFNQRTPSDMSLSERIESVANYYEAANRQGQKLNHGGNTSDVINQKYDARKITADTLGIGTTFVQHSSRIIKLVEALREQVYSKACAMNTGYKLSFLEEDEQRTVADILASSGKKIEFKDATALKEASENKTFSRDVAEKIILEANERKLARVPTVNLSSEILSKYFGPEQEEKEIQDEILKALEYYRTNVSPKADDG